MRFQIPLLLLVLLLNSCTTILKPILGYHNPKIETPQSIAKYCDKKFRTSKNLYIAKKEFWEKNNKSKFVKEIPQYLAFNQKGDIINVFSNDSNKCNPAFLTAFNNQINGGNINGLNTSIYNLDSLFYYFTDTALKPTHFIDIQDSSQIYIAYLWTKFLYGPSKKSYHDLETFIKANPNTIIKILLLNADFQQNWNLKKEQYKVGKTTFDFKR